MQPSNIEKKIRLVKDTITRSKSSVGNIKAAKFLLDLEEISLYVEQHAKSIRTFPQATLRLEKVKEMLGMYKVATPPDREI